MPYIQPSIFSCFLFFISFLFCFVKFHLLYLGIYILYIYSLLFALRTGSLYISVTLLIFVTSVVSYKLLQAFSSFAISSYSKCSNHSPPLTFLSLCALNEEKKAPYVLVLENTWINVLFFVKTLCFFKYSNIYHKMIYDYQVNYEL